MNLDGIKTIIIDRRATLSADRSLLVGISGIDASGKGFIGRKLAGELESADFRVALINVDGWLNLPTVRFSDRDPAAHFYCNALRLDQMFERLIKPLTRDRTVEVVMDHAEETASEYRQQHFSFSDVDIVLLDGIFIFKRQFADLFDVRIWIECSFETALERAIKRGQEALSAEETVRVYNTIYFPAQRIHLAIDAPLENAIIVLNSADDPNE